MIRLSPVRALTIVACLLILGGISAAVAVAYGAGPGHAVGFDVNVIEIFFGLGLLVRRRWALRFTGMWVILNIVLAVLVLCLLAFRPASISTTLQFPLSLLFPRGADTPRIFAVAPVFGGFALYLWAYRVLIRDDVRALFDQSSPRMVRL